MSAKSNNGIDSEFINIFAHDIKTPLSAVKGCIDLVEQFGELNEKQLHYIERAMTAVLRMEKIVHNLLDYSRLDEDIPLDLTTVDLRVMIDDAIELFENDLTKKKIQLMNDIDSSLGAVMGDENLLIHVVENLLGNAIKYNKTDGKIWITVSDERDYVRVDVQDTGIGIAPDDQKKVFDKFYRGKMGDLKIKGNGLGLAIARMIVEKHQGHIWVNSKLGYGSTFSFTIPRDSHHGMGSSATDSGIRNALTGFNLQYRESAVESIDDVDDNIQETIERGEDSPRDEYEP